MKTYRQTAVFAVMIMVSVTAFSQTKIDDKPVQSRNDIVPRVDYHTHLLGPYALPLPDPLPPEIKLPAELERLLIARARLVGNVGAETDLKNVFTEDALLLNAYISPTDWMPDKYWFMRYLNLWSKSDGYRFAPNHYAVSGDTGYIAGTVFNGASGYHIWNFLFGIRKGADNQWRIAVDSTTERKPPRFAKPITADRLIKDLDDAGIKRAVVLSEAFWLGGPAGANTTRRMTEAKDEWTAVRGENDWTAEQVARFPDRLVFACAADPLKDYAAAEIERCAKRLKAKAIKINLSGLGFSFENREQVRKIRSFFQAANDNRLSIVVHLEPGKFYGPKEVAIFLNQIVSAAPEITIQIAHLAGNGPGITSPEALEAFAVARESKNPLAKNLYFDFAGLVYKDMSAAQTELMAQRMRQIGLEHVLFGSDVSPGIDVNPPPIEQWTLTRRQLPLTDSELRIIAENIAPYLR